MKLKEVIQNIDVWSTWVDSYKKYVPQFIQEAKTKDNWRDWDNEVFKEYFEQARNQCVSSLQQGYFTHKEREKIRDNWGELAPLFKQIAENQDVPLYDIYNKIDVIIQKYTKVHRRASTYRLIAGLQPKLLCTIVNQKNLNELFSFLNKNVDEPLPSQTWNWYKDSYHIAQYFKAHLKNINSIDIISYPWQTLVYFKEEFDKDKIEKRIARLTWNENGWVKPSGRNGKSQHKDTHEEKYGYGHEEWIFDTSKIIEGYHYGFLEPIRKEQQAYENKKYNVWLYTINGISKKRYWVGEINNVEVIDNIEAEKVKNIYSKNGWLSDMENDIKESGANNRGFSDWNGVDLFNIKFKVNDIKFGGDYFELSKEHEVYKQSRYSFANFKNSFDESIVRVEFKFSPTYDDKESSNDNSNDIKTSCYDRKPKSIEISYVHKAISDGLKEKLKAQYGEKNVSTENRAGYGNNSIDLVVQNSNEYIFYEIKTYNSSRTSIREAIGQLLEYSCWTNNSNASKLVIVSQKLGDVDDSKIYIRHLRDKFGLPLYFQTFDLASKELSEEY